MLKETQPYTYRADMEVFESFHPLRNHPNKLHIRQSHLLREWQVTLPQLTLQLQNPMHLTKIFAIPD